MVSLIVVVYNKRNLTDINLTHNIYMKSVLVLDANQRSALATTRSLGQHNVSVITCDESATSLAGSSKYSQKYLTSPSPSDDSKQFIQYLVKVIKEFDISIVFPMTELTTTLLLVNKEQFEGVTLPFSNIETVNLLADKCSLMRLAKQLDIPYPKTMFESGSNNTDIDFDCMDFPLVLKPGKSWLISNQQWIHTEVKFANTADEARDILKNDPAFHQHPFMIQKCVAGHGEGIFSLYNDKSSVTFFRHQRIREKPPWGGVSVLSKSAELDPTLHEYSKKLLDHVGWHGIAMVEFKVDSDGTAYLMEINTRFWGSLQLAIDAGVNFPWMLYQISCGSSVDPVTSYSTKNKLRWLLGDFDSLYIYLKSNKYSFSQKAKRVLHFFTPTSHNTKYEVNRWSDLGPFKWEIKHYLNDLS